MKKTKNCKHVAAVDEFSASESTIVRWLVKFFFPAQMQVKFLSWKHHRSRTVSKQNFFKEKKEEK